MRTGERTVSGGRQFPLLETTWIQTVHCQLSTHGAEGGGKEVRTLVSMFGEDCCILKERMAGAAKSPAPSGYQSKTGMATHSLFGRVGAATTARWTNVDSMNCAAPRINNCSGPMTRRAVSARGSAYCLLYRRAFSLSLSLSPAGIAGIWQWEEERAFRPPIPRQIIPSTGTPSLLGWLLPAPPHQFYGIPKTTICECTLSMRKDLRRLSVLTFQARNGGAMGSVIATGCV